MVLDSMPTTVLASERVISNGPCGLPRAEGILRGSIWNNSKGVDQMNTIFNRMSNKRRLRMGSMAITAMLVLATLAAALPQPALAAKCSAYYTVKAGDTTSMIAHTYGLVWKQIAKANNIKSPYKLKVGQTLCIPAQGGTTVAQPGKMSAGANGNGLRVNMSGFDRRYVWIVKVKDSSTPFGTDYKVGQMVVPGKTSVTGFFNLPQALRKTPFLTVCVKNSTTDAKICQNIAHKM
jgi:LysM repeat protein